MEVAGLEAADDADDLSSRAERNLGLSTVNGIVSQSGGAIWTDSTLGEGTCFTVCLPVAGDAP